MTGYPTAYRSASRQYTVPQAFDSAPGFHAGIEGQPGGFFPKVPYVSGPGGVKYGEVLDKLPPKQYPSLHPPLTGAPPVQLPAVTGVSAGAMRGADLRAARIGRKYNMAGLAYRLYNQSRQMGYGRPVGTAVDVPGGQLCWQCGPVSELYGSFGDTCISSDQCGTQQAGPPGAAVGPPHRRIWGGYFQYPTGILRWVTTAHWIRPENAADPSVWTARSNAPLPLNWNFPEVMPIQKPVGIPQALPYRARPALPESEYRVVGPGPASRGGRGDVEPPVRTLSDTHMRPVVGVRERKFDSRVLKAAYLVANAITESDDELECAWKALDAKQRSKVLGRKLAGVTMYYWQKNWARNKGYTEEQRLEHNRRWKLGKPVHQTPQTMVRELLEAGGLRPDQVEKYLACRSTNTAQDTLIGKTASDTSKSLKKAYPNQWFHIGSGPAL